MSPKHSPPRLARSSRHSTSSWASLNEKLPPGEPLDTPPAGPATPLAGAESGASLPRLNLPWDEDARLRSLHALGVLGQPVEERFSSILR